MGLEACINSLQTGTPPSNPLVYTALLFSGRFNVHNAPAITKTQSSCFGVWSFAQIIKSTFDL